MERVMSRMGNYVLEQEENGYLKFNDSTGVYEDTGMSALVEQKERLEWEIWSSQRDLQNLKHKIKELSKDLGL